MPVARWSARTTTSTLSTHRRPRPPTHSTARTGVNRVSTCSSREGSASAADPRRRLLLRDAQRPPRRRPSGETSTTNWSVRNSHCVINPCTCAWTGRGSCRCQAPMGVCALGAHSVDPGWLHRSGSDWRVRGCTFVSEYPLPAPPPCVHPAMHGGLTPREALRPPHPLQCVGLTRTHTRRMDQIGLTICP